jgi:CBS domain-containing protein
MKVREMGLKEVTCVQPSTNLAEVASMMKRHNIGAIPVCDGDKLIGMLTDRDLVISCMAADVEAEECPAREFMTAYPVTATPDTDIEQVARLMGKEQLHRIPVVEGEKLVGIVSLADLARSLDDDRLLAETIRKISSPAPAMAH